MRYPNDFSLNPKQISDQERPRVQRTPDQHLPLKGVRFYSELNKNTCAQQNGIRRCVSGIRAPVFSPLVHNYNGNSKYNGTRNGLQVDQGNNGSIRAERLSAPRRWRCLRRSVVLPNIRENKGDKRWRRVRVSAAVTLLFHQASLRPPRIVVNLPEEFQVNQIK